MKALEIITGHVIYNPTYTCKFQLKTTFHNPFSIEFQLYNHLHIQKPLLAKVCQGSNQGLKQLKAEFTYNSEKYSILI